MSVKISKRRESKIIKVKQRRRLVAIINVKLKHSRPQWNDYIEY